MDVVRLFTSLIAVHRQQQQTLAQQGEIQAEILAQLLEQEDVNAIVQPNEDVMDDAEAHLILLEEALTSTRLSNVKCRLASLLGDESLRAEEPGYVMMKASLLDHARETEIQKQQDFSSVRYDPRKGPRELGRGLECAAQRWLRPEKRTAMEVVRCVALQKFISLLPEAVGAQVLRRCPRDMEQAMCMAEEHLQDLREDEEEEEEEEEEESSGMDGYSHGAGHAADQPHEEREPGGVVNIVSEKIEGRDTWGPVEGHIVKEEAFVDEDYLLEEGVVGGEIDNNGLYSETGHTSGVASNAASIERYQLRNMTNMVSASEKIRRDVSASVDGETAPQTPTYLLNIKDPSCGRKHQCLDCHCGKHDSIRTHLLHRHNCGPFKMFPCLECDQRFESQKDLTQHRRNHAKIHCCPECGKNFRDKYNLKCHLRTHTGERPYTCQYCGKKFGQEHGLLQHLNIHTGEKPFCCTVCGMGFHHSRTLKKHTVLHSQERPFLCAHCGVTFKLNDTLKRHLRTHVVEGTQDVNKH